MTRITEDMPEFVKQGIRYAARLGADPRPTSVEDEILTFAAIDAGLATAPAGDLANLTADDLRTFARTVQADVQDRRLARYASF